MALSRNKIQALLINDVLFECNICVLFSWKLNVNLNVYLVFSLVTNLLSFDSMLPFKFPLKVCILPVYFF